MRLDGRATPISFFSELKRRNVHRMAALYLGGAWLIMQVVDLLIDRGPLPEALGPLALTVLAIGFPVALLLAWFLEVTPAGIKVDVDEEVDRPATGFAGRRVDFVIIAVLAAALGVLAYDKWWIGPPPERSVAVLPFANMSGDPEQEYFSDGLSDTLIHVLAQVSGLKVTAKTSSFFFKGKNIDVGEIGRQLNVGTLLEGSVQRAGNRVRVIAQLVSADDGTHLWSKSFDRELEDIFMVQDEIAGEVVEALKVTLLEDEEQRLAQRYQPALEAYEQLIRGRHEMDKRTTTSLAAAEQHFKQAIELDPDYALAYVNLANTHRLQLIYGGLVFEEAYQRNQPLVEKALQLDPLAGSAHFERAILHGWQQGLTGEDHSGAAEEAILKAIELSPNTAEAYFWHIGVLNRQGRFEEALAEVRAAAELDPMSPITHVRVAYATWGVGRVEEALALVRRNIERNPEFPNNYGQMFEFQHRLGHLGEAQKWLQEARKRNPGDVNKWGFECYGFLNLDDVLSAEQCARQLTEAHPDKLISEATWPAIHRYRGEWQQAIATMESVSDRRPGYQPWRRLLADWIAGQGDIERARGIMAEAYPDLLEDRLDPAVTDLNAAVIFAAILHANGEQQQRDVLLLAVEEQVATMPRVRGWGYGIVDVYVYAMRGDRDRTIAALREAVDEDWRANLLQLDSTWWTLRDDWKLQILHQDPEFIALLDELEGDIAAQRQWYQENRDKPLF